MTTAWVRSRSPSLLAGYAAAAVVSGAVLFKIRDA
jgi:hypothetical protein